MKKLCGIFLLLILIAGCDSGSGGNNGNSCDPLQIAFVPIPECVTDYLFDQWIRCTCAGEQTEFEMLLQSVPVDGFNGTIAGSKINWEQISCTSISFTGGVTGVFNEMTVPERSVLEFVLEMEGSEPEFVSCCCGIALVVD